MRRGHGAVVPGAWGCQGHMGRSRVHAGVERCGAWGGERGAGAVGSVHRAHCAVGWPALRHRRAAQTAGWRCRAMQPRWRRAKRQSAETRLRGNSWPAADHRSGRGSRCAAPRPTTALASVRHRYRLMLISSRVRYHAPRRPFRPICRCHARVRLKLISGHRLHSHSAASLKVALAARQLRGLTRRVAAGVPRRPPACRDQAVRPRCGLATRPRQSGAKRT